MADITGLAGLYLGTSAQTLGTLAGVSYQLAPKALFPGVTYDRFSAALTYVGGAFSANEGPFYPLNLFSGVASLSLSDGTRTAFGGGFEFATDAMRFAFTTYPGGVPATFYVTVDGKLVDTVTPTMPLNAYMPTVTVDLSKAGLAPGYHDIKVSFYGTGWLGSVTVPTGATVKPVAQIGPRIVFLGDSISGGTGAATIQQGYVAMAGALLGSTDVWNSSWGGTGYETALGKRPALVDRIVSDGVAAKGDIYVVAMGLNDSDASTTLRDSVTRTLAALVAGAPDAKIFIVLPWNPRAPIDIAKPVVRQTIREVAAQFAGVTVLDPTGLAFTTTDTTHPDNAGHEVLAEWLATQIRDHLGADGVVEQNVAGDVVGPLFVDGVVAGQHYAYAVLEAGQVSTRFEVLDSGDAFPVLKLKAGQKIGAIGAIEVTVTVTDDKGMTTSQVVDFAVRQHLVGTAGANVLQGTGDGVSIDAGAGNDKLVGTAGADLLLGGPGNDTLIGNGGIDKLVGGTGDDSYFVDNAAEIVVEQAGEGMDTVTTTLAMYDLADNVEVLILGAGALQGGGNALANVIIGNDVGDALAGLAGNDKLYGGAGNDSLYGGEGNDTLWGGGGVNLFCGGAGNDSFYADNAADVISEQPNQGIDTVYTAAEQFVLPVNVEALVYTGSGNFTGAGSLQDNTIRGGIGNDALAGADGNDALFGGAGDDVLSGGSGADSLYGGSGANTLSGGTGNDIYFVDSAGDLIVEYANEGSDAVYATVLSCTLPANVEVLAFTGAGNFAGTGNALDNSVRGGGGGDTLAGGEGNDSLLGNGGDDLLYGGAGNDFLYGGAGQNTLAGGAGNDNYYVDSAADLVVENAGEGIDAITTSLGTWLLGANIETLVGTSATGFTGTGNALDNTIRSGAANDALYGGDGNDSLYGAAGNDLLSGEAGSDFLYGGTGQNTLVGGAGNDLFYVDSAGDVVIENPGEGTDAVYASVAAWTLSDNVESLVYTGNANFVGLGNALGNIMRGSVGNDSLEGGGGDDVLYGGGGYDTLVGGAGADKLNGGAGADRFVFRAASDIAPGDTIVDFSHAEGDRIELSGIATEAGLALDWIGGDVFHGHAGDVRMQVSGATTSVQIDLDGDRHADLAIALQGVIALTAGDFIL